MPTYGPWIDGPQWEVPGFRAAGGRNRFNESPGEFYPGVDSEAEVDALYNTVRLETDGGAISTSLDVISPSSSFYANCILASTYDEANLRTVMNVRRANDHGWWFIANYTSAFTDYLGFVAFTEKPPDADGYEIEGGTSAHVESVDSASIEIELELFGGAPLATMQVGMYTAPATDYTDLSGTATLRETRELTVSYPAGTTGTTPEDPLTLALTTGDFEPSGGGVQVYPNSTQANELPDWETGGYIGDIAGARIWLRSTGTYAATYMVTFPRYRYVYDDEAVISVVRNYPRRDGLGFATASRNYPPVVPRNYGDAP